MQILQLASWNVWGKSFFQIADVLSDQGIHFDIIALQEVGGLSQGKLTTDGFLAADDPNVQLHDELRARQELAEKKATTLRRHVAIHPTDD